MGVEKKNQLHCETCRWIFGTEIRHEVIIPDCKNSPPLSFLGIIGDQLRAPPKTLSTIVMYVGFQEGPLYCFHHDAERRQSLGHV